MTRWLCFWGTPDQIYKKCMVLATLSKHRRWSSWRPQGMHGRDVLVSSLFYHEQRINRVPSNKPPPPLFLQVLRFPYIEKVTVATTPLFAGFATMRGGLLLGTPLICGGSGIQCFLHLNTFLLTPIRKFQLATFRDFRHVFNDWSNKNTAYENHEMKGSILEWDRKNIPLRFVLRVPLHNRVFREIKCFCLKR